jgi:hypothetical protein
MNKQKNELVSLSKNQSNPYLCDPRDFVVIEACEVPKMSMPFHNQCGSTTREYRKLLREGEDSANASDRVDETEQHPDVNRAGRPHTKGMGDQ